MSSATDGLHLDRTAILVAAFAFDAALCFALCCFIVTVLVLRRKKRFKLDILPIWKIVCALSLWAITALLWVLVLLYPLISAASKFFEIIGTTLLFYILYDLLHLMLRETQSIKTDRIATVSTFHWVFTGIIAALGAVDWALGLTSILVPVVTTDDPIELNSMRIECLSSVIRWLVSWEILAWAIFLAMKTVQLRASLMAPSLFCSVSAVFFCLNWFIWAVYNLVAVTVGLESSWNVGFFAIQIIQAILSFCFFTGLLLCCFKWGLICRALEGPQSSDGSQHHKLEPMSPGTEIDSAPILEVDASGTFTEAASRPVFEADSKPVYEKMHNELQVQPHTSTYGQSK